MSISNLATGLRPGVCTSTTRPTSPYTGFIIYETDTGYLRVWDGSAWDYLSQKQDYSQGLGVGRVLQVQSAQGSTQQTSTSSTYTDITGLSISITPQATTNKILIVSTNSLLASAASADSGIRILRDSTNIFTSVQMIGPTNSGGSFTSIYLDSPSTTSSVTYKAQFNRNAGTGTVYSSITNTLSNLLIMEIAA